MKVQVLGNIERNLKDALETKLSEYKNIDEISDSLAAELGAMADTKVEYVKYNSLLGKLFNAPAVVKIKRASAKHSINASLSNKKQILKYTGSLYNVLYSTLGYNRISVESNLLYIKGTASLFKIGSTYNADFSERSINRTLASVNKNIKNYLLKNYLNLSAYIDKVRKSVSIEYNINRAMKASVGLEKEANASTNKLEVSVNPVDHKYAKVISTAGFYRTEQSPSNEKSKESPTETQFHKKSTSFLYSTGVNFYLKAVYPIFSAEKVCEKRLEHTKTARVLQSSLFKRILGYKNEEYTRPSFISYYIKQSTVHTQAEVETSTRFSLFSGEMHSIFKGLGVASYTIQNYGVLLGGLVSRTYAHMAQKDPTENNCTTFSPLIGFTYLPKNSFIDGVSIYWELIPELRKKGIVDKLYSFQINLSKEY